MTGTERIPQGPISLVADVGGTNTRCALARGREVLTGSVRRFTNADYASQGQGLDHVLRLYLTQMRGEGLVADLAGAAVAIAGPVKDGAGELTNVSWHFNRNMLADLAGTGRAEVLNDLQAQGYALEDLAPGTLLPVLPGEAAGSPPDATKLVIGAGTGFNIATVFRTPSGLFVPPAEAGHVSLPVRGEDERRLHAFLETQLPSSQGFASVEDVLSGRGLENVYLWLSTEAGHPQRKSASAIMAALTDGSDPLASATARIYVQVLGNVAGNLALTLMPYGGIYLIGGVVRRVLPWMAQFGFAEAFADKGRMSGLTTPFRVQVVEDDFAALTGCAVFLDGI